MKITSLTNFISIFKNTAKKDCSLSNEYHYWRIRIFYSMFIGYVFFYFTRKSYNFVMPVMLDDLGFSKSQVGILGTALYLSYGVSKFVSGIMSEYSNPRYFMALGLAITGVINICFGFSSSVLLFTVLCFLNGWFQGWGWPPCAKLLTYWYAKQERGLWWSLCSTSHNVGGMLIPVVAAGFAMNYGWRVGMFVPGVLALIVSLYLLNRLRDIPESLGLPTIEEFKISKDETERKAPLKTRKMLTVKEIIFKEILGSRWVWMLSLSYFFVYVVRIGINDWAHIFLKESKGYDVLLANSCIFWFELGGILGMLLAGFGSDAYFRGNRIPVIIGYTVGLLIAVPLLWYLPPGYVILDYTILALIGFLIFGPQMLVGLAVAECVNKQAVCSANGFAGFFANIGSAAAAYPIGFIIDKWHWEGYFICLFLCCILILCFVLQLVSKKQARKYWRKKLSTA